MPRSQCSDTSLVIADRFRQRGVQIDKPPGLRLGHPLLKGFRNPGIIVFHDELGHLRPLSGGKSLELLDQFRCAHGSQNNASILSP